MRLSSFGFLWLGTCLMSVVSCGSNDDDESSADSTPTYESIAPIVTQSCAVGTTCHSSNNTANRNALDTAAGLKENKAQSISRLNSGDMPRSPASISAEDKSQLLSYLNSL